MASGIFAFMDLLGWGSVTKANWLRTSGSGLFTQIPGANAALRFFQAGGGTMRRTDFLAIRRQVLDIPKWSEQIASLRPTTPIPAAWISGEHGLTLKADEIYYRQQYGGYNSLTGEDEERWMTVLHKSQLTNPQVQDEVLNIVDEDPGLYSIDVTWFGAMEVFAPKDYFA